MRTVLFSALVLALAFAAFAIWSSQQPDTPEAETPRSPNLVEIPVDAQQAAGIAVVPASRQAITREIRITGVVAADESKVAHIFPLAEGVVERVFVQLGSRVDKGQPLLIYDNIELGELIGEYGNFIGSLNKLEAQRNVAQKLLARADSLLKVEAISEREYDLRQAEYQQAVAEVESRRAELARVEEKLHRFGLSDDDIKELRTNLDQVHRTGSHNTLRAPFSGVITRYDVSQGEVVDRKKELFTIVDTSTVWVLGDVYEKDIQEVGGRGECTVELAAYPGQLFRGQITYLSDALDPASRTAKLRCVVPNDDGRLKLEMFGTVRIATDGSTPVLTVPTEAIQEVNGQAVIFVQRNDAQFERRDVKLGDRSEQRVQVLEGVQPGEKVVANGSFYLKSALLREQIGEEE